MSLALRCRLFSRLAWHLNTVCPPQIRTYRTKSTKAEASPKGLNLQVNSSSKGHHDLESFLRHAAANKLNAKSTYFKGTAYEYVVIQTLARLGFALTRIGGPSDLGIDLVGHWTVPSHPLPVRVLLQCKAHTASPTPENVRALEGAFSGAPAGWQGEGAIALLVCKQQATKGMREAMIRSACPMGFVKVTLDTGGEAQPIRMEGCVEQLVWNHVASSYGLEGLGVTTKYHERSKATGNTSRLGKEIALVWNGAVLGRGSWRRSKEAQ